MTIAKTQSVSATTRALLMPFPFSRDNVYPDCKSIPLLLLLFIIPIFLFPFFQLLRLAKAQLTIP